MKRISCAILKFLIIINLTVSTSFPLLSQVHGGVKGGANFLYSAWDIPEQSISYSGVSYHAGVYGNFILHERLFLQSEIQFNSFKIDYSGEFYTANYLSLPVACSWSFLDDLLNLHAGPQISFLLTAKPEFLETAIDNWELAVFLGSGFTLKRFHVTARYILGITNLASDDVKAFFPDATIKNSNFQLSVGYQLFGKPPL